MNAFTNHRWRRYSWTLKPVHPKKHHDGPRRQGRCSRAEAFIDFATENVEARVKELTGEGAHAVLAVSGSEASFTTVPKLVRNLGVTVCVGLPRNDFNLPMSTAGCAARGM